MNCTFLKLTGALAALLVLGGCTVGPAHKDPAADLEKFDIKLTDLSFTRDDGLWKQAAPADSLPKGDWWAVFEDPVLSDLLEQCRQKNPDLASAFYRMEQAREAAHMTRAQLYPWANVDGSYSRRGNSSNLDTSSRGTFDEWRIGAGLTWDIDLFGRVRSLLRSETANAQALHDLYQNTLLALQVDVANTYFLLRQYKSEIILLERTLKARKEQTEYVSKRARIVDSDLDLQRTLQQEHEAAAQLAAVMRNQAIAENYMCYLLGDMPGKLSFKVGELSDKFPKLPQAVPSQLLERRPDVAAAERQVAMANAQIGAATAAFFPTFSVTGNAGMASSDFENLFNASSFAWGISPQVYIPLFQAGRLSAQQRVYLVAHKQSLEQYRSTVLKAVREVEDALANVNLVTVEYQKRLAVSEASKKVEELTHKSFELGYIDYFPVSDAQRLSLANEREQLRLKSERLRSAVSLIGSLGGGWSVNEPQHEKVPPQSKQANEK